MEYTLVPKPRKYRYNLDGTVKKPYSLKDEIDFINGLGVRDQDGIMQWVNRDGRIKPFRSRVWLLKEYLKSLDKRVKFVKNIPERKIRQLVTEAIYCEGGSV